MSEGSLLSHIGISPERFLETPPGPRGEEIRAHIPDLHAHVDGGRAVEERDLPALTRERALGLKNAVAAAVDDAGRATLDARLLTDAFLRSEYRKDQNVYLGPFFLDRLTRATPDVVFQPVSAAEIGAALAWARAGSVPVTLRGAGSTAMGGSVPAAGGLVLDLTRLDSVEILESDGLAVLGAGARFRPVHEKLKAAGLALRVYTSNLGGTFAGWFATGGIGLNAYVGGRAREAVRWADAVLLSGDVVRLFRGRDLEIVVLEGSDPGRFTHLEGPEARDWFAARGLPPLALDDLCGSEGQLAVLTRVAVETQPLPEPACFLLAFGAEPDSFAFVDWVRKWGGSAFPHPLNLKWLSPSHLHHARQAWADDDARAWRRRPSAFATDAALPWKRLAGPAECGAAVSQEHGEAAAYLYLDFASADAGRAFVRALGRAPARPAILGAESVRFAAERFRPQSVKRLGPGLLAAEILMPAERVPGFLRAAPAVARGPSADVDAEVYYLGDGTALVIAGYLIDHRHGSLFDLLLAPALVDLALERFEGRPYVLGRWQSGYFRAAFGRERAHRLRDLKDKTDPDWILGRGAFFGDGYRGALGKMASAGFVPGVRLVRALYAWPLLRPIARGLQAIARGARGPLGRGARTALEAPPAPDGTFAPEVAATRAGTCVNCGECNSVCPVFRDSWVRLPQMLTHLGERVAQGEEPGPAGSVLLDLCMRCGNCEEVCQAGIPHLPMYEAMQRAADQARPRDRERQLAILGGIRTSPRYARDFLHIRDGGYLKRTPASLPGGLRFLLQRAENEDGPAATCIHCGACVPVCPTAANLEFQGEDPRLIVTDQSRCIGCGTCVEVCPANHLNGGQTLRVMEAPTLDWVRWMREEVTP